MVILTLHLLITADNSLNQLAFRFSRTVFFDKLRIVPLNHSAKTAPLSV